MQLPDIADVENASERIRGVAVETPLLTFPVLDEAVGGRVFVKPENLQHTGSFKFRGAYNCISRIAEDRRPAGVVACSSGNHAQGVAAASKLQGIKATIVMPSDAPANKLQRTRDLGADIVTYDRATESRDEVAGEIVAKTDATFVHPYDNRFVIAGQGTVGLEIAGQIRALGAEMETMLTCAGGGGLTAGITLALESRMPDCEVVTCEPVDFDDHVRSFETGDRQMNTVRGGSICDALLVESPGEMTFAVNSRRIRRGLAVSDAEALDAVGFAAREMKLVVEPGGAVALAALLTGKLNARDKSIGIVLSGGNIDPEMLARAVGSS